MNRRLPALGSAALVVFSLAANRPKYGQMIDQTQAPNAAKFPPDDTASNLDPGDRSAADFPQFGHGSIKLTALFNDPTDKE